MRYVFKRRYEQDLHLWRDQYQNRRYRGLAVCAMALPFVTPNFFVSEAVLLMAYATAGIGLMLLTGFTGLVSLGHSAFFGIGAYVYAIAANAGVPFPLAFMLAGTSAAVAGIALGLPTLRLAGTYLAIATLAFAVIVEQLISKMDTVTGGFNGLAVRQPEFLTGMLGQNASVYMIALAAFAVTAWLGGNILRSPLGRALRANRDSELSAKSLGIDVARYRLVAFAISAGMTGLGGGIYALYAGRLAPSAFGLQLSVQLMLLIMVGGLASLRGAMFGAIFVSLLPQAIAMLRGWLPEAIANAPGLESGMLGFLLVVFLIYEPEGIDGRFRKLWVYFEQFPLYRKASFQDQRSYTRTERLH
ncbi:MAG: branched-chain amino acid ABC transporter permease [Pseudomonadales bacterium]